MQIQAHAKINLTLDVGRLRPDGYHDVSMVMQAISLCDHIKIDIAGNTLPRLFCDDTTLPNGENNLALRAATAFSAATGRDLTGLAIHLEKHIPAMAGLGGGSADAAAVLIALNRLMHAELSTADLQRIGLTIGSDVPFCVQGGAALAEGRGERLTAIPTLPPCGIVLIQPAFQVSTGALYRALDSSALTDRPDTAAMLKALQQRDLKLVCRALSNVFEQVLPPAERAIVAELKAALLAQGALGALLTGTGSVVYGLFATEAQAQAAAVALHPRYPTVLIATPMQ
jgi:4-diphosphocytidyl-2C-methyl-D-erythritol kinase